MTGRRVIESKGLHSLVAAAFVSTAMVVAGCQEEQAAVSPPSPVRVMTVVPQSQVEIRRYPGVVIARFESDLGFRVPGKIVERKVNVGDAVKAGQLLARLDATDFQLNVEAQGAELDAAKSNQDAAIAAEARYKTLFEQGWAAKAALDQRTAAADEARGRVQRAQRALSLQRNQLAYAELRADRDGVVSALPVEAGQVVTAGQLVARVARLDELEAVVAIPEQSLDEAQSADAKVSLWPDTGKTYDAKLREIAAQADPATRTFDARYSIMAPNGQLRLGQTANVTISSKGKAAIARLPLSAVMNDGSGALVWVVSASGDAVQRRAVTIQSFEQDEAIVSSGLAAGDRVVTLGVHMLDEKRPVRIVEIKTASAKSTPDEPGSTP